MIESYEKSMVKKNILLVSSFVFGILILISLINTVSSQDVFFCAERTLSGAWCQNVPQEEINTAFRQAATSCESTSFCKLGTCVDSVQGLCRPNVPQRVCQEDGGVWQEGSPDEIPQCNLGCCYLGEQASFTTQTHCTALSSDYGVETNFRQDIKDQFECIASASPNVRGACVIDDGFSRGCRMLTQSECQDLDATSSSGTTIEFHEGLLCSAEQLATNCGPSQSTTCVENKDEVYFLDTCGNVANIYDSTRVSDQDYWTEIINRSGSCNPFDGNSGSATCGSCAYDIVGGSTCKAFERNSDLTPTEPRYGDFVCADLSCKYNGETYEHGEEWCGTSEGIDETLPGSEYHKLTCFFGEVGVTMCEPFRQTRCVEDDSNGYSTAFCAVNEWQDCIGIDSQEECENIGQRDCQWIEGTQSILGDDSGPFVVNSEGELVQAEDEDEREGAVCVPRYAPGFNFWDEEANTEESTELCLLASENCVVRFEKGLLPPQRWECEENCHCAGLEQGDNIDDATKDSEWFGTRNSMCIALGDCGAVNNWAGNQGYYEEDDLLEVTESWDPEEEEN